VGQAGQAIPVFRPTEAFKAAVCFVLNVDSCRSQAPLGEGRNPPNAVCPPPPRRWHCPQVRFDLLLVGRGRPDLGGSRSPVFNESM
jgi:hypothetical protein